MSFYGPKNFGLETSLGNVPGYGRIFKFGQALDCDLGIPTDIWDGADGTTSTDIWVRPASAETHTIVGGAADTAAGTGMQAARVFGLTSWGADEVFEDVEMNGAGGVTTVNTYVILYRMKGIRFGSGGANSAIITATADVSGTVTAAIQAGHSQTLMAIYGVPSTKKICITDIDASVLRAGAGTVLVDLSLLVDERADQSDSGFLTKHVFSTGSAFSLTFDPPLIYTGPCLIKIQVVASANNAQTTASFNAYLVDV
jgi:hypothetical protein